MKKKIKQFKASINKIKSFIKNKIIAPIKKGIAYPFKQAFRFIKWFIRVIWKLIVLGYINAYKYFWKPVFEKTGIIWLAKQLVRFVKYLSNTWLFIAIRKFYRRHREAFWGYLFISLWLIGYLAFTITPLIQSFFYSLNDGKITTMDLEFIKFGNYKYAFFTDLTFPPLLVDYIGQIILIVPITIVFALIIAMLLNQNIKARGFWRVIFFLPVVISTGPVINSLAGGDAATVPILNNIRLQGVIMQNLPPFIYRPILSLFGAIIMILWYTGIPTLIFLAGLQKIDRSVYEAAAIDGASPWESFWKVTLPAVKQFITVNIIYVFVTLSYYSGFAGNEIIDYIRRQSFEGGDYKGFGYGSAIAWLFFLTVVILIMIFVGLFNMKREKR